MFTAKRVVFRKNTVVLQANRVVLRENTVDFMDILGQIKRIN